MEDTRIDWTHTPLREFLVRWKIQDNRIVSEESYPHGKGEAQEILFRLWGDFETAYEKFIPYETDEHANLIAGDEALHWERTGEVSIIRDGRPEHIKLESITLADLPDVRDTLKVLEQEHIEREREERERKKAERRNRERVRAKEKRKRKKLGEW